MMIIMRTERTMAGTVQGCVVLIMQGGPIRDDRV
jgi:hypothetical protein